MTNPDFEVSDSCPSVQADVLNPNDKHSKNTIVKFMKGRKHNCTDTSHVHRYKVLESQQQRPALSKSL